MSKTVTERSNAELPSMTSSIGVFVDGKYIPPPEDRDGKSWIRTTALIQSDPQTLYLMWRDVQNAPQWQEQVVEVTQTGERTSHWTMRVDDKILEWDAEILNDQPGRRIAWESTGGDLCGAGEVVFEPAPGNRGTLVTVLQEFQMGKVASTIATIGNRNPKQTVVENLRHFKALAETGEIPRTQGQPHGPRGLMARAKQSTYGEKIPTPPSLSRVAGSGGGEGR
jgi:uncharacterized membrane protein